jgi:maleate cis-trans isomerase
MTVHFGVLIPSTNTTTETEYSRLPGEHYQAHYARLLTSTPGRPFAPGREEDIDYQSKLLGTARVQMVVLIQTSASVHADDYDAVTMERMTAAAGVPSITSAAAMGHALRALEARRIGLISPYSKEVNARTSRYFSAQHGLDIAALDGFASTDSYSIGQLGPERAEEAFARMDSASIDAFAIPGANFPTLASLEAWERRLAKPVVTSSSACLWAVARVLRGEPLRGYGRLLAELPGG